MRWPQLLCTCRGITGCLLVLCTFVALSIELGVIGPEEVFDRRVLFSSFQRAHGVGKELSRVMIQTIATRTTIHTRVNSKAFFHSRSVTHGHRQTPRIRFKSIHLSSGIIVL